MGPTSRAPTGLTTSMEGSRRFFSRVEINHLSSITSSSFEGSTSLRHPDSARGAGQVRPDTNMDGGPFKLPTKENADAARKKKVRRVPSASSNDPQTLFLIDSQQPSHLGTPPVSPRRKRSPRSRSGWSRTSRRNTSRIARASSTSPRYAPSIPRRGSHLVMGILPRGSHRSSI